MPMSAEECRAHAETCERMAQSLGPGKCRPPRCHARGRRSVASARNGRRGQGASQFKLTHYPPSAADADFSERDSNPAGLERLWRRLQPLAIEKMPLDVPRVAAASAQSRALGAAVARRRGEVSHLD